MKHEPLLSDEEIEGIADSTVDRGLRAYIDAVTTGGSPDQTDMEWTADTLEFARRIESLVRKNLAERLRNHDFFQTEMPWKKLSVQEQAARIVEED